MDILFDIYHILITILVLLYINNSINNILKEKFLYLSQFPPLYVNCNFSPRHMFPYITLM